MPVRVADLIVRGLETHGVERIYCVPGESYLALLDALHDSNLVQTIVCRHESGAGFMALAEAKLTGRPAVFAVTRGPGATNGSIAIHVADQDAVPVIMLVGQVSREERGRKAFQEVDYSQFFSSMTKAVFEVHDPDKMAETLARSFSIAASGVPGPVVISLPEDVLVELTTRGMPQAYPVHRPGASSADADAVTAMLTNAERPLIMAGGMMRGARGAAALAAFAEQHEIPVAATWKNQDVFDNSSPLYAGHLGFGTPAEHKKMLMGADLVVAVGTRLGDIASQNYSFPKLPEPEQPLIHIYPDAEPIGATFRTDLGIIAEPAELLERLAALPSTANDARRSWTRQLREFVDEFMAFRSPEPDDGVDFGCVVTALARHAREDAIIVTDAGNMSSWVHRHWRMSPKNTMIGGIAGAMGLGVPGAVAASLAAPERMAIVVVGDGGTLMTGQEIATAVQYGAKPKVVISNNACYGTIRTHQEKFFPKRVSGTELTNPDFTAWGKAFGVHTVTIKRGDDVDQKVKAALDHDGACIIDVHSSKEAISAFTTISKLRGAAAG
ncbi:MAG: thiamine pyrophosphate-dependent enzyme [Aestuariivirgaceae bacterium]